MHSQRIRISVFLALGLTLGALALALLPGSTAWAQSTITDGTTKTYVLSSASGTWGATETSAVVNAGGHVVFSHAGSGIASVTADYAEFAKQVIKTGKISQAGEDMMVQWQAPVREQLGDDDVIDQSVNATDDRFINVLWNMRAIHAPDAWALGYDGTGVRVAVIDGGMCSLHPDVAPGIDVAASRSFVPGFNWFDDTGGLTAFRHACHVAGIIAARDNTIGTVGVAPHATIISCKALHGGSGTFSAVIEAILYASDPISAGGAGADIINMSLGALFARGGGNTGAGALVAAMNRAVNYATAHNVLVVSAAGNNAVDLDHSQSLIDVPAQSGSGIAISATAPVDWAGGATNFTSPASYTNFGNSAVWVGAPGGDFAYPGNENCAIPLVSPPASIVRPCWVFDGVLSPGSQSGSYFWASGTSMASPHVAGVAALLKQKYPSISVGDLKTMIASTVDQVNGNGNDPYLGHGFLNAGAALTAVLASNTQALPTGKAQPSLGALPTHVELAAGRGLNGAWFAFNLPAAGHVRVDLYDVAGRSVATIFNGAAGAGVTRVSWNGQGSDGRLLSHGAYFARVRTNGEAAAAKLVLVGQ